MADKWLTQLMKLTNSSFHTGKNLKCEPSSAADASMNGIESTTKKLLGDAHLMLYFGFGGDGYTQGGGLAESAIVCTPKKYDHRKHSINCYGKYLHFVTSFHVT